MTKGYLELMLGHAWQVAKQFNVRIASLPLPSDCCSFCSGPLNDKTIRSWLAGFYAKDDHLSMCTVQVEERRCLYNNFDQTSVRSPAWKGSCMLQHTCISTSLYCDQASGCVYLSNCTNKMAAVDNRNTATCIHCIHWVIKVQRSLLCTQSVTARPIFRQILARRSTLP